MEDIIEKIEGMRITSNNSHQTEGYNRALDAVLDILREYDTPKTQPSSHGLWEYEHPYYCSYKGSYCESYESFDSYLEANSDSDDDLNLLFRWDWDIIDGKDHLLSLYYVLQRKGVVMVDEISVVKDDEERIREFLESKLAYLKKVWEPI